MYIKYCILLIVLLIISCTNSRSSYAISFDGNHIYYNDKGKNEPTIVFIHGFSITKEFWDYQVNQLSNEYRTVSIDLAGFGESDTMRQNWTIEAFGKDVVAVINKLKLEKVVLVGVSMGATVAFETAKLIPDKTIGIVPVEALRDVDRYVSKDWVDSFIAYMKDAWKTADSWSFSEDKNVIQRYIHQLPEKAPDFWWDILSEIYRWINDDFKNVLQEIETPVYSINAGDFPTTVEKWREYVPTFDVAIVNDAGHYLVWEKPDTFNAILSEIIDGFSNNTTKQRTIK